MNVLWYESELGIELQEEHHNFGKRDEEFKG